MTSTSSRTSTATLPPRGEAKASLALPPAVIECLHSMSISPKAVGPPSDAIDAMDTTVPSPVVGKIRFSAEFHSLPSQELPRDGSEFKQPQLSARSAKGNNGRAANGVPLGKALKRGASLASRGSSNGAGGLVTHRSTRVLEFESPRVHSGLASRRTGMIEENYAFGPVLGSGHYSTVRLGQNLQTGERVAIKIVDRDHLTQTEIEILKRVSHPNIVKLKEIYETSAKYFLVLELLQGGELFSRIVGRGSYTEKDASQLIRKLAKTMSYLHSQGIVHRDLKPENIVFASTKDDSEFKLIDFGLAKILADPTTVLKTPVGTPFYIAPEILDRQGYTLACDAWSIGVIAYILLCGFPPFLAQETPSNSELFSLIKHGSYGFPDPYWTGISDQAKDFVSRLLVTDPAKRMTVPQMLVHPWLSGVSPTKPLSSPKMLEKLLGDQSKKMQVNLIINSPNFALPESVSNSSLLVRRKKKQRA